MHDHTVAKEVDCWPADMSPGAAKYSERQEAIESTGAENGTTDVTIVVSKYSTLA